jgi:predicted TIM-barrel fold metal-dependent hydrolase
MRELELATAEAEVIAPEKVDLLAAAEREALKRGLFDVPIMDCDSHHYESSAYREIAPYIRAPSVRRPFERYTLRVLQNSLLPANLGDRNLAGRIRREYRDEEDVRLLGRDGGHPVARELLHSMRKMAIDTSILFPTPMLVLGTHPQVEVEVELAYAYNRWLVENVLPASEAIKSMLYLPVSDPEACVEFIVEFGDKPGVVGFLVTTVRYQPLYQNRWMPMFSMLDERSLPLAFHSAPNWGERAFETMNRFIGVHALGFPFYAMVQLTNLVLNGIPDRFPNIRFIFMESGIAWIPFMIARLDNEWMLRPSEAPLLQKKPGEYIRDFYFTTQPIELMENPAHMQALFEMCNGENRFLYASDYPHQDFDLPQTIWDLGFIGEEGRRKILGGNAFALFGLDPVLLREREARREQTQ